MYLIGATFSVEIALRAYMTNFLIISWKLVFATDIHDHAKDKVKLFVPAAALIFYSEICFVFDMLLLIYFLVKLVFELLSNLCCFCKFNFTTSPQFMVNSISAIFPSHFINYIFLSLC